MGAGNGYAMSVSMFKVMTPFKKSMLFFLSNLVLLGLDKFAGRYLFGEGQLYVAILCFVVVNFSLLYWGFKDQHLFQNSSPEVKRRKRALMRLLRAKERKEISSKGGAH